MRKSKPDIYIRIMDDMPDCLHGMVMEDVDGGYNIYLKAEDAPNIQRQTLEHELSHIHRRHLQSDMAAYLCEIEADLK